MCRLINLSVTGPCMRSPFSFFSKLKFNREIAVYGLFVQDLCEEAFHKGQKSGDLMFWHSRNGDRMQPHLYIRVCVPLYFEIRAESHVFHFDNALFEVEPSIRSCWRGPLCFKLTGMYILDVGLVELACFSLHTTNNGFIVSPSLDI